MFFQQCLHFAKDQLSLERGKSACVCAVPDPEKAASGQSLTQYLSHFCNTTLFQYSLKYSGFINPFRTTCCSPKGMKPAAVSILPYENLTQQLKLWDCSLQLLWATFFSVTCSEYTKHGKRSSRGFSMKFLCARQPGPPEF